MPRLRTPLTEGLMSTILKSFKLSNTIRRYRLGSINKCSKISKTFINMISIWCQHNNNTVLLCVCRYIHHVRHAICISSSAEWSQDFIQHNAEQHFQHQHEFQDYEQVYQTTVHGTLAIHLYYCMHSNVIARCLSVFISDGATLESEFASEETHDLDSYLKSVDKDALHEAWDEEADKGIFNSLRTGIS